MARKCSDTSVAMDIKVQIFYHQGRECIIPLSILTKNSIYTNWGTNHTMPVVLFVFMKVAGNRTRKKQRYRSFGLYLRNSSINFPSFWYGNSSYSILRGNHIPYAGKILKWAIINLVWSKFGHFWPKLSILSLFCLYF